MTERAFQSLGVEEGLKDIRIHDKSKQNMNVNNAFKDEQTGEKTILDKIITFQQKQSTSTFITE